MGRQAGDPRESRVPESSPDGNQKQHDVKRAEPDDRSQGADVAQFYHAHQLKVHSPRGRQLALKNVLTIRQNVTTDEINGATLNINDSTDPRGGDVYDINPDQPPYEEGGWAGRGANEKIWIHSATSRNRVVRLPFAITDAGDIIKLEQIARYRLVVEADYARNRSFQIQCFGVDFAPMYWRVEKVHDLPSF